MFLHCPQGQHCNIYKYSVGIIKETFCNNIFGRAHAFIVILGCLHCFRENFTYGFNYYNIIRIIKLKPRYFYNRRSLNTKCARKKYY